MNNPITNVSRAALPSITTASEINRPRTKDINNHQVSEQELSSRFSGSTIPITIEQIASDRAQAGLLTGTSHLIAFGHTQQSDYNTSAYWPQTLLQNSPKPMYKFI